MTINEHLKTLAGKPVANWDPKKLKKKPTTYRISVDYEDEEQWIDQFAAFLDGTPNDEITGLVVGAWNDITDGAGSAEIVEALVTARDRLPNLTALFLGDIISEECEISWIQQTDISPLFAAYPQLEYFGVRGSNSLELGALQHANLKTFMIESGGLAVEIVQAVLSAELPALEHLELWLGTPDYGGDSTIEDLASLLSGASFPKLRYLGLRDSAIADDIALAIVTAPILERIEVLDLSLGTLTDQGAQALLDSQAIRKLKKLDLHHHYCSDTMMKSLKQLGIQIDLKDQQEADEDDDEVWRYVAVGE